MLTAAALAAGLLAVGAGPAAAVGKDRLHGDWRRAVLAAGQERAAAGVLLPGFPQAVARPAGSSCVYDRAGGFYRLTHRWTVTAAQAYTDLGSEGVMTRVQVRAGEARVWARSTRVWQAPSSRPVVFPVLTRVSEQVAPAGWAGDLLAVSTVTGLVEPRTVACAGVGAG